MKFTCFISVNVHIHLPHEVSTTVMPILQIRKLRLREGK